MGMENSEPAIVFDQVCHTFGQGALRKQILFDICVEIQPGEIIIMTGPSGSGKTTALTLAGAACSNARRTESVNVSMGVVVQLTWGAGSRALHNVPFSPMSTVKQRYMPSLYGGGSWANIIIPK